LISFGSVRSGTDVDYLLRASAIEFGAEGYQQHRRYLDWLYGANPTSRGLADCLVARQGEAVVGCMHRMMLPLAGPESAGLIGVLHNHFVTEPVRSGPGVLLLRRAIRQIDAAFAPGVQAPLDEVYRRLNFVEVPGWWLMRVLDPVGGAIRVARTRLTGNRPLRVNVERLQRRFGDLVITPQPDDATVDRLCEAMRDVARDRLAVDWTPALVRWRYFHPQGPRHLLITPRDGSGIAVIAPGIRRGLATARLMELTDTGMTERATAVMRAAGAALALCFTTAPGMAELLQRQGWRVRGNRTFSFRTGGPVPNLTAATSDVGFETFNTVFD